MAKNPTAQEVIDGSLIRLRLIKEELTNIDMALNTALVQREFSVIALDSAIQEIEGAITQIETETENEPEEPTEEGEDNGE